MSYIPFNKPSITDLGHKYLHDALAGTQHSGDGPHTKVATQLLCKLTAGSNALLTTSCTHALEMTGLLLNLKPGDEIILPSFTFVSTANAYVLRGAIPIFADVDPATMNIDPKHIETLISSRTKAIVVVHYAGIACEMDGIMALATKHGIPVIEDNAHGLGGSYKGKALGSFGVYSTNSFHETKNVSCGEGGALIINEHGDYERAEIMREKGTDRSRFFRGQVDRYTWVDAGSSYLPSDILAAVLRGALESFDQIQVKRKNIFQAYEKGLSSWAKANGTKTPLVPEYSGCAWHMFYMILPDLETRSRFIQHMKDHWITCVFHYLPLHESPFAHSLLAPSQRTDCPHTVELSDRLVRLPLFNSMLVEELERVIEVILKFSS